MNIEVLAEKTKERARVEETKERIKGNIEKMKDIYKLEMIEIFIDSIKD